MVLNVFDLLCYKVWENCIGKSSVFNRRWWDTPLYWEIEIGKRPILTDRNQVCWRRTNSACVILEVIYTTSDTLSVVIRVHHLQSGNNSKSNRLSVESFVFVSHSTSTEESNFSGQSVPRWHRVFISKSIFKTYWHHCYYSGRSVWLNWLKCCRFSLINRCLHINFHYNVLEQSLWCGHYPWPSLQQLYWSDNLIIDRFLCCRRTRTETQEVGKWTLPLLLLSMMDSSVPGLF